MPHPFLYLYIIAVFSILPPPLLPRAEIWVLLLLGCRTHATCGREIGKWILIGATQIYEGFLLRKRLSVWKCIQSHTPKRRPVDFNM